MPVVAGFMGHSMAGDNYIAAVFVFYNIGNKEIVDLSVRLNP